MGVVKTAVNAAKAIDRAATKAASRPRGKVLAGSACPPDQCVGCGRRVTPNPDPGQYSHCNKPACVRKAAALM